MVRLCKCLSRSNHKEHLFSSNQFEHIEQKFAQLSTFPNAAFRRSSRSSKLPVSTANRSDFVLVLPTLNAYINTYSRRLDFDLLLSVLCPADPPKVIISQSKHETRHNAALKDPPADPLAHTGSRD